MNRRRLSVIGSIIAVGLFVGPLVSPVPDYGPHLSISVDDNLSDQEEKNVGNSTTVYYHNLSSPAQDLFDEASKGSKWESLSVPMDKVPDQWTTLHSSASDKRAGHIYVRKGKKYYQVSFYQNTPAPSFPEFMLRLGSLFGAIGLGALSGYFVLTAEG